MASTRLKTLHYLRAIWLNPVPGIRTLESYAREAYKSLTSVTERTIERESGQTLRTVAYREDGGAVMIHLTADTPGEQASIVPAAAPGIAEVGVRTIPPPNDAEFMDGDAFLNIIGNDVCVCMSVLREGSIMVFLHKLFKKANISSVAHQFSLMKVADADAMAMITSNKMKEIQLRSTVYQATASYVRRRNQSQSVIYAAARQLKQLAGAPHDVTPDGLQVELTIKPDRRDKKHLTLAEKRVEEFAIDLINNRESGDRFKIVLQNGQSISDEQIVIRTHAVIPALGKSVERDEAWNALGNSYAHLVDSGIVEQ